MSVTAEPTRPSRPAENEYVLGTHADESVRLGFQHRLWSASAHALWERAGFRPGMTIADIGCGPGHAAMDIAQIVGPTGRVICVDESATYLHQVADQAKSRRLDNVERVLGDVHELGEMLGDRAGGVDAAYARWVFCFVSDPERVVRGLARLIKPGGCVAVQDYFNYETMTIAPKREEFSRVIRAVGKSWRDRGGDPDIVGRLPGIFRANGFEITLLSSNQRVARPGEPVWYWPDSFWAVYVPRLKAMGYLSTDEVESFMGVWRETSRNPDAFMFLPPVFDLIARRV